MRTVLSLFLALVVGCDIPDDGNLESGGGDGDTSDTNDTNDTNDTGNGTCEPVTSGTDWAWKGGCPRMRTPCDIVVTECSLAIDYEADGGMDMDMPHAATVVGSTVTFADDNSVTGCVGTVQNADSIEGTCDGGCDFTLTR